MPFIITENHPKLSKSAWMSFFLGTQARVRNSRGKRAISIRATEVLLYLMKASCFNSIQGQYMVEFFILILCEKGRKYNRKNITINAMKCLQFEMHFNI